MFKIAFAGLRRNPTRVLAPIISIMISLGFIAAISIFMETVIYTESRIETPQLTNAQISVQLGSSRSNDSPQSNDSTELQQIIADTPGVSEVEPFSSIGAALKGAGGLEASRVLTVPSENFRWASLTSGQWPSPDNQIVLSASLAKALRVGVGDSLTLKRAQNLPLTVCGISDDPSGFLPAISYISPTLANRLNENFQKSFLVKTTSAAKANQISRDIDARLTSYFSTLPAPKSQPPRDAKVQTTPQAQEEVLKSLEKFYIGLKVALLSFAAVSVLVGMIITANTFTILLAGRRRQIGLMRAVGATGAQVRRSFLFESMLIGVVGALAGLALGVAVATIAARVVNLDRYGMILPWTELGYTLVGGVLMTVLAATIPAWRTAKVAPLEALQPVVTVERGRRIGAIRIIICALFIAGGSALVWVSLIQKSNALTFALGAGCLLSIGILGLAPIYVPGLLRITGLLMKPFGPTATLAVTNSIRNPKRSAATATALMLAVGIVLTLQIGAASVSKTSDYRLRLKFPIALSLNSSMRMSPDSKTPSGLLSSDIEQLRNVTGVQKVAVLQGAVGKVSTLPADKKAPSVTILAWSSEVPEVAAATPPAPKDNELLVCEGDIELYNPGSTVKLKVGDQSVELVVRQVKLLSESSQVMVSPATLAKLTANPVPLAAWASLAAGISTTQVSGEVERLNETLTYATLGGSFLKSAAYQEMLHLLLTFMTAFLAVAVLVALVGVGNMLSLSVLERTRESALLRAIGMQRSSLRVMLLVESLLLGAVSIIIGAIAGTFFGWLGALAALKELDLRNLFVLLSVDWFQAIALVVIVIVSAALASVLPGRRAAMTAPAEALATE